MSLCQHRSTPRTLTKKQTQTITVAVKQIYGFHSCTKALEPVTALALIGGNKMIAEIKGNSDMRITKH